MNKIRYNFYTDNELPFQFATMQRSKGELVRIHKHKQRKNLVESTTEVLIIKSGFIKVTLCLVDFVLKEIPKRTLDRA